FTAIGLSYVPAGYTVQYRKSLTGRHYRDLKLIQAPRPVTRKSLYIFLHECAHANLHAAGMPGANKPVHVKEHEAEVWAHGKMRENGVAVPRSQTARAKHYVAGKIAKAGRRARIDPAAARYAKGRS